MKRISVTCFCQTDTFGSPKKCEGIPLLSLAELKDLHANKNIFLALSDEKTSRNVYQMLQRIFYETAHIYECGEFIQTNLRHTVGSHYCLICGNRFDTFEPMQSEIEIFKKYHIIGGGSRRNFRCPCCGSSDRERWSYKLKLPTSKMGFAP